MTISLNWESNSFHFNLMIINIDANADQKLTVPQVSKSKLREITHFLLKITVLVARNLRSGLNAQNQTFINFNCTHDGKQQPIALPENYRTTRTFL